ncbi:uncharacterized protein FOMMEDRAFT_166253 [Fomitiporia mediterranea MF3/22]|uniref:uncharacterized protein n=1 Tax=Fomitiporia mediterranea (strain MF3/22) TaxID=694068 RepID=UPI0004407DAB|nr:uncharacterized protein FOMMEDRAFT_166253 [Fomitiporia mediterranea MF3/22]EJD05949.1 hypothetical protein FOMMEDRAFT_166253 [Fomitiporia mediterranea MF3/22]
MFEGWLMSYSLSSPSSFSPSSPAGPIICPLGLGLLFSGRFTPHDASAHIAAAKSVGKSPINASRFSTRWSPARIYVRGLEKITMIDGSSARKQIRMGKLSHRVIYRQATFNLLDARRIKVVSHSQQSDTGELVSKGELPMIHPSYPVMCIRRKVISGFLGTL